jgi:hypothetical protein
VFVLIGLFNLAARLRPTDRFAFKREWLRDGAVAVLPLAIAGTLAALTFVWDPDGTQFPSVEFYVVGAEILALLLIALILERETIRDLKGWLRLEYALNRMRLTRDPAHRRRPGPVDTGTHYFGAAVHQIRASDAGSNPSSAAAGATLPRILDVDDLTVLTGWAEAVAETLAHAPERIPALMADARPGAAWRSELGIAEPSAQLGEAISSLDEKLQAATRSGGTPTFDAALVAASEDRSGEHTLGELVDSVLRSTLEQHRSRQLVPDS